MEATSTIFPYPVMSPHLSDSNKKINVTGHFSIVGYYWPLQTITFVAQALQAATKNNYEYRGISQIQDDEGVILDFTRNDIYKAIEIFDDGELILTVKHGTGPSTVTPIDSISDDIFS